MYLCPSGLVPVRVVYPGQQEIFYLLIYFLFSCPVLSCSTLQVIHFDSTNSYVGLEMYILGSHQQSRGTYIFTPTRQPWHLLPASFSLHSEDIRVNYFSRRDLGHFRLLQFVTLDSGESLLLSVGFS